MTTVERRAEYFKITAEGGDNGLFGEKIKTLCEQVNPVDREQDYKGTSVNIELLNTDAADNYIRGVVKQIRITAPSKRKRGNTESKTIELEQDEGINEMTHFIYCPDTSFICLEYNYHGPKLSLLVHYINRLFKSEVDAKSTRNSYVFITRGTALKEVEEKMEVRSIEAKLQDPKTLAGLGDDYDLPEVFEEFKPPKLATIEIRLKSKVRGGPALLMKDFTRMFVRNKNDLAYYDKLVVEVSDETGKAKAYDLVHDKLSDTFRVPLHEGTAQVNTESIMRILEDKLVKAKQEYIM